MSLLFKHEQNERGMIRSLMEYGLKPWDDQVSVADYIFSESADLYEMIDNKRLLRIMDLYKNWYESGLEPTLKNFLYHEDQELSMLAVSVVDFKYELSPNWKNHYEGKIASPQDLYKEDVRSSMRYLRYKKIMRLMEENQRDLLKPHTHAEWLILADTHNHLKEIARSLAKEVGMTYFR
jgi:DNA primase